MNINLIIIVLIVSLISSGLGIVYTEHKSRKLFIQLQNLQVEKDQLQVEWGQLQLEQSTLATDAIVDHVARTRLNMIIPDSDTVVYVTQ